MKSRPRDMNNQSPKKTADKRTTTLDKKCALRVYYSLLQKYYKVNAVQKRI